MVIILRVRVEGRRQERLSILAYFSDCIGFLTQNRFCDTQYRIDFDPSLVFFEKNCPYIA